MAEEVYQPGENEATVLMKKKAENIRLSDILYLIQGTGIDRDRQMTLEQLRNFLQNAFNMISMRGTSSATFVGLDGVEVGGTDVHSKIGLEEASFVYGGNRIKISKDNLEINGNSFSLENGVISISGKNARVEIDGGRMRILSSYGILTLDADGVSVSDNDDNNRQVIVSKDRNGNFKDVNSDSLTSDSIAARIAMIRKISGVKETDFLDVAINMIVRQAASFDGTATFNNLAYFSQKATFDKKFEAKGGFKLPIYQIGSAPQTAENGDIMCVHDSTEDLYWLNVYDGGAWHRLLGKV